MTKEPTLRDLPAIFRIAMRKHREGKTNYLDASDTRVLKKSGLPFTRNNISLYNRGGATAAVCMFLTVILFYDCNTQEFARQPIFWRLLASATPVFVPSLLLLATNRLLPAFALGLRYNFLMCLIGYVPLCLIYNFAAL